MRFCVKKGSVLKMYVNHSCNKHHSFKNKTKAKSLSTQGQKSLGWILLLRLSDIGKSQHSPDLKFLAPICEYIYCFYLLHTPHPHRLSFLIFSDLQSFFLLRELWANYPLLKGCFLILFTGPALHHLGFNLNIAPHGCLPWLSWHRFNSGFSC